jgi:hypothetical protein
MVKEGQTILLKWGPCATEYYVAEINGSDFYIASMDSLKRLVLVYLDQNGRYQVQGYENFYKVEIPISPESDIDPDHPTNLLDVRDVNGTTDSGSVISDRPKSYRHTHINSIPIIKPKSKRNRRLPKTWAEARTSLHQISFRRNHPHDTIFTVAELKRIAGNFGLSSDGTKYDLCERLRREIQKHP